MSKLCNYSSRRRRLASCLAVVALLATACGTSREGTSSPAATSEPMLTSSQGPCSASGASVGANQGAGAGYMQAALKCAANHPLKAKGAPYEVAFENSQGDPAAAFPDFTAGVEAAVDYINNDLGGIGGDPVTGKAGRPIKLDPCFLTLTPSAASSCTNQLVSAKPFLDISGINFFGALMYPAFLKAGVPVVDDVPIEQADFVTKGVYSIGAGGGCVGDLPPLEVYAAKYLHAKRLAIPYTTTSAGELCYYDLQNKVVNIINGSYKPTPSGVTVMPSVTSKGFGFAAGSTGDLASLAAQVLAWKPGAVMFAAESSDCFNVLNSLEQLGYNPQKTPMIMAGSCPDTQLQKQEGSKANGIYVVGAPYNLLSATGLTGLPKLEVTTLLAELKKYEPGQTTTSFETQAFQSQMSLWLVLTQAAMSKGGSLTSAQAAKALGVTKDEHQFAGLPWGCASAAGPYYSICSTAVSVLKFHSKTQSYTTALAPLDTFNYVTGTKIVTGP